MKRFLLLGLACASFAATPVDVLAKTATPEWIPLQDGKSLAGWQASKRPESWVVEDGMFVTHGGPSHLFYVGKVSKHDFRNFEISAEVMTSPGANSGIYVHTKLVANEDWPSAGYELQVINSNPPAEKMGGYIEHKMTGSIYAVRNTWVAPVKDNEWFNYRIRVVGKTIQTFINDKLICEYAEPAQPYRPKDKSGRLLGSGTFALQAHDPSSIVKFRNIRVKMLPNDAAPPAGLIPIADPELDRLITQASNDNIPLIDMSLAAPRENADEFWSEVRRLGFTPLNSFSREAIDSAPGSMVLIFDADKAPDIGVLKAVKAAGTKVAFSSKPPYTTRLDTGQIKRRLQAIYSAELDWKAFWVPGKP